LRSSWEHCSDIVKTAEAQGFRNILCPSSYQVGQDTLSFVAGCAPITDKINLLAAVRCGEMQPIMLARTVATLDHMLQGRLTINIISSDFPGQKEPSPFRYQRSREVVEILKQAWTQDEINHQGEVYQFADLTTDPVRPYQTGGPLLYFGGYSPDALELCGQHCDVYLMWPETIEELQGRMKAVNAVAERYNRTLDYGLRTHVIVRDTETEAREYADYIVSKLDDAQGEAIRNRALDSKSLGVSHQAKNREKADDFGYVEPNMWTGVGRARSGCGAAIVGSTDQVLSKLEAYHQMGIRSFILSGYPHLDEADHFGKRVLPQMKTCSLPHEYGRVPAAAPQTPLGVGERR
jgi:alkanesulfonate monooxygenase